MSTLKTKIVETLVDNGFPVLRITENEHTADSNSRYSWWIPDAFDPSCSSNTEPVDYHTVVGVEITEFVNMNQDATNARDFLTRFEAVLENSIIMTCQFHKDIIWKKYVSRDKKGKKSRISD